MHPIMCHKIYEIRLNINIRHWEKCLHNINRPARQSTDLTHQPRRIGSPGPAARRVDSPGAAARRVDSPGPAATSGRLCTRMRSTSVVVLVGI